jgi:hypothetical protein
MPKHKPYKFLGPWLRRLRIKKGIDRSWLAKKMHRTVNNVGSMETGHSKIPNMAVVRSWLIHINALDQLDVAKRLYMIDGDKLEVSIAKLGFDDRLRLIAIYNFLTHRDFRQEMRDFIDDLLSQETVTVVTRRMQGHKPKEGELPVKTEFELDFSSQEITEVREYTYEEVKNAHQQ